MKNLFSFKVLHSFLQCLLLDYFCDQNFFKKIKYIAAVFASKQRKIMQAISSGPKENIMHSKIRVINNSVSRNCALIQNFIYLNAKLKYRIWHMYMRVCAREVCVCLSLLRKFEDVYTHTQSLTQHNHIYISVYICVSANLSRYLSIWTLKYISINKLINHSANQSVYLFIAVSILILVSLSHFHSPSLSRYA